MPSEENFKLDRLGNEIHEGSIIAAPDSKTRLIIGRVEKIAKIQIGIKNLDAKGEYFRNQISYKYPEQVICLDKMEELILYLLSRNL